MPDQPQTTQPTEAAPPVDARISFDDLMRVDLRVARIVSAERVPNSRKLVQMRIDLGSEERTIVAGIAEAYDEEGLVGRTIAVVANLKPARLMGIESNGMLLAATGDDGRPMLVSFDGSPAPGIRIR